jgi:hypothetical protein
MLKKRAIYVWCRYFYNCEQVILLLLLHAAAAATATAHNGSININKAIFQVDNKQTFIFLKEKRKKECASKPQYNTQVVRQSNHFTSETHQCVRQDPLISQAIDLQCIDQLDLGIQHSEQPLARKQSWSTIPSTRTNHFIFLLFQFKFNWTTKKMNSSNWPMHWSIKPIHFSGKISCAHTFTTTCIFAPQHSHAHIISYILFSLWKMNITVTAVSQSQPPCHVNIKV